MSSPHLRAHFGARLALGLSTLLCATACGAVDPSSPDELDAAGDEADLATQTEALTVEDGYVQSLTLRTVAGDARQIAYTHNGAKIQLETSPVSGKATLDAPLTGQQRGQATLKVTCVNANGTAIVKSKTGIFNLIAGAHVTYVATCDPSFNAAKAELVINPSDGVGQRVPYHQLPVAPTADRDITVQVAPPANGQEGRSYHFVEYGYLQLDTAPAVERASFRYQNESNFPRQLGLTYRVQCDGMWKSQVKNIPVAPLGSVNFVLGCDDQQQLQRAEARLQGLH